MSSSVKNIAIVGAGGNVGSFITLSLLATGKHTVTAITRESSSSKMPEGVKVAKVNYDDPASLAKAMEGQDALVITMGVGADKAIQRSLIDAAAQAGVKYVMPNEFGVNHSNPELGRDTFLGPPILEVRQYVEKVAKDTGKDIAWIGLTCSFWYEFSLAGTEARYGFDFAKKSVTFFDDGNTKINTSTWPQVGRAVAAIFSLPPPELERRKFTAFYISSFHVSQRDMLGSALRVTDTQESDWNISYEPSKERYQRGLGIMKEGGEKRMLGFGICLYTRVFYPNGDGTYEDKLDNEMLRLPKENFDEATRVAIEMAEGADGSIERYETRKAFVVALRRHQTHDMSENNSRLLELAKNIQTEVKRLHDHLVASNQPFPSFDAQKPTCEFEGVDDLRSDLLDHVAELQDLLQTPKELIHFRAPTDLASRHAIDRFKIFNAIPVGETRTYAQIAEMTKVPIKALRRLLRHAMTQRIFCEPDADVVSHTQVSRLLVVNEAVRDYVGTVCQEVWPAATRIADAIEKWPGSRARDESGYVLAHGHTIQQTLDDDPVKSARYARANGAFQQDKTFDVGHLIRNFDWAALGNGTVVDVGGGVGVRSRALAKAFTKLSFEVQDLPWVVADAEVDKNLEGRVSYVGHDFFTEQPHKDADVYFFCRVFMEWQHEQAVKILQALKPALKEGAKILIQDFYVPEPGTGPLWQERRFRNSDLLALALANGGQRDKEEWEILFRDAGPGFEFKGVNLVPKSDNALIEAIWRGSST